MKKRLLAVILALMMIIALFTTTALAQEPWDGTQIDTSWYTGHENDESYTISSAAQLAGLAKLVNNGNTFNGKTIKLGADIDLGGKEWTPIGTDDRPFQGTFDGAKESGGNYTLSNLYINKDFSNTIDNCYVGLFGLTNAPAIIKNIDFVNVDIQGGLYVGTVVGYGFTGQEISNCNVSGRIEIDGWWYIGGIGGNGYINSVADCSVTGDDGSYIKANNDGSYVGGIWGYRGEGAKAISGCSVTNITISGTDRVGGICGIAHYQNTIEDCGIFDSTITSTNNIGNTGLIAGADLSSSTYGVAQILDCTVSNTSATSEGTEITTKVGDRDHQGNPADKQATVGTDVEFNAEGKIIGGLLEQASDDLIASGLTKKENDDGTFELIPENVGEVAAINHTYYTTLAEAVNAAEDGDTIYIYDDVELSSVINAEKVLTFVGVTKSDGRKPTISSTNGGIFSQAGNAQYTLENLELEATRDGQWYIYHSANTLMISGCDFTMADGVSNTGNVIMGEGSPTNDDDYSLVFTNNTIKANSRAALTGIGNNSVITGNDIDLISEHHGTSNDRTSIMALTAEAGKGKVTITGNTFRNANRALAVDNSTLDAGDLTYSENKFINVRYAFELDPVKNADQGVFDLNYNYYEFNGTVSAPKIEDASSDGSHFEDGEDSTEYVVNDKEESLVSNDVYYLRPSMNATDLNTYEPTVPTPHDITIANTANGTVDTSLSNASAGAVITITATPNSGYGVSGVAVTGPNGTVAVTRVDANTYTFVMPDGPVTVSVTFGNGLPFTDVSAGQWFYDYVSYVYFNGLMNGTSATTFEPNANMTRAMVWAILARIDGETVTGATWQTAARSWAMANGVSDGSDPNGLVTREQFATMLWRYEGEPASSYSLSAFSDAGSLSNWAETAMSWAVEHGVITGMTDTTLVPQGTATRAQCAAMLMRFVEL